MGTNYDFIPTAKWLPRRNQPLPCVRVPASLRPYQLCAFSFGEASNLPSLPHGHAAILYCPSVLGWPSHWSTCLHVHLIAAPCPDPPGLVPWLSSGYRPQGLLSFCECAHGSPGALRRPGAGSLSSPVCFHTHQCSNLPFAPHSRQSGSCFHLFSGMAPSKATSDVNCKRQGTSSRHFAFALCEALTPPFWKRPPTLASMFYPSDASPQMSAVFSLQTQPLTFGVPPNRINGTKDNAMGSHTLSLCCCVYSKIYKP